MIANSRILLKLYDVSVQPLKSTGQPKEGDMNFVTRGMLIALGYLLTREAAVVLTGVRYVGLKEWKYL